MKLSCMQEDLSRGLVLVRKAIPSKSPMDILYNVLLTAQGNKLKLTATNLEMTLSTWVVANVETQGTIGTITIPAGLLSEFVSALPSDRVYMSLNEHM